MTEFIKLHRVNIRTCELIPKGELLVNVDKIVTVEREGEFSRIAVSGDVGYYYVYESYDEIERKVGIYIDDLPANLFFKSGGLK